MIFIAGCGGGGPSNVMDAPPCEIKGKITLNGGPFKDMVDPSTRLVVAYVKMEGDQRPDPVQVLEQLGLDPDLFAAPAGGEAAKLPVMYTAFVDLDLTYSVEVDPGKYVVVVRDFPFGISQVKRHPDRVDALKGKYGVQKSPLVYDIEDSKEINLDLKTD